MPERQKKQIGLYEMQNVQVNWAKGLIRAFSADLDVGFAVESLSGGNFLLPDVLNAVRSPISMQVKFRSCD
jgi:hypothetical protein